MNDIIGVGDILKVRGNKLIRLKLQAKGWNVESKNKGYDSNEYWWGFNKTVMNTEEEIEKARQEFKDITGT